MNVTVHVDADTHERLSRVQEAFARQYRRDDTPYTADLLRNIVLGLALERGAEILEARHCDLDEPTTEHPPGPPASDPVAIARRLQTLYGNAEARERSA